MDSSHAKRQDQLHLRPFRPGSTGTLLDAASQLLACSTGICIGKPANRENVPRSMMPAESRRTVPGQWARGGMEAMACAMDGVLSHAPRPLRRPAGLIPVPTGERRRNPGGEDVAGVDAAAPERNALRATPRGFPPWPTPISLGFGSGPSRLQRARTGPCSSPG